MATVHSLGIHHPTALSYLIAEDILPADGPAEAYRWHTYRTSAQNARDVIEEEILIADACVVWSKSGTIRRVLNLTAEDEAVLHAFTTFFPCDDTRSEKEKQTYEQALVVVLRTQVHILLLSGDSHVLPVPYEVESAFPCPNGFLIQRKVIEGERVEDQLVAPLHHDLSTINESQGIIRSSTSRPSLVLPEERRATRRSSLQDDRKPRTFSCVEKMAELGLVVSGPADKAQSLDECHALPNNESLLYVSPYDELQSPNYDQEPLCIAVTHDTAKRTVTIWQVASEVPVSTRTKSKSQKQARDSTAYRRKSSNAYGRSQNIAPREPHPLRMSFGGLAQTFAENTLQPPAADSKTTGDDELANQLGPEFEHTGVQTRSARRVSSMIARTDLGAPSDRGTFHDLAASRNARKSVGRLSQYPESVGSFHDRQSFGIRRRSSFHATASVLSNGTSYLGIPSRSHVDDFDPASAMESLSVDDMTATKLRRDIGFFGLTTVNLPDETKSTPVSEMKVLVIAAPDSCIEDTRAISVCILDRAAEQVAIVDIGVESVTAIRRQQLSKKLKLKVSTLRKAQAISDIALIKDGHVQRLLVMSKTRQSEPLLNLEAPWSPSFRIHLPASFLLLNPIVLSVRPIGAKKDDISRRGVIASSLSITSFFQRGHNGQVGLLEVGKSAHTIDIQLEPEDIAVRQVLLLCNLIFGRDFQDALLVALWEVQRWLRERESQDVQEWSALVVCLFTLAVPFIDEKAVKTNTPSRRKRGGLLRSASGTAMDLTEFDTMNESHWRSPPRRPNTGAWDWILGEESAQQLTSAPRSPQHTRTKSRATADDQAEKKDPYILRCIGWAREFCQSPAGEAAIGTEGYLPTAINKERDVRQTALAKVLIGMHLLYEEQKLTPLTNWSTFALDSYLGVLAQLGTWLGWSSWTMHENGYYINEFTSANHWYLEDANITGLQQPNQPFTPPSILQALCKCLLGAGEDNYPSIDLVLRNKQQAMPGDASPAASILTPRTLAVMSISQSLAQCKKPIFVIDELRIHTAKAQPFLAIPDGFTALFRQAMAAARVQNQELTLDARLPESTSLMHARVTTRAAHHASKDYHAISSTALDVDSSGVGIGRWDLSWETDRVHLTKLIFHEDRRYREASRLVNQTRPPVVECNPEPGWSEADLLEAQKDLTQLVARRTLSVATGRAMLHYSFREPLLTERVPIAAFSLQCLITSRTAADAIQPMTFSADKSSFTEEKVCWAFFHNGASSGLTISKDAKCIDTSWILYNKPQELTNRHAGFLLALGLNGHLKSLAKWVAFKYLTPKHTMTSIGLLLGMSASFIGTQDQLITRLLSVHVTRLLPPGAAELNLSPLTQTSGIMGIGLLYHNSQHRRMSEVMLSELENNDSEEGSAEDQVLRDEGYRLAAGFSLGLINLGQGNRLHGLKEMSVPERLLGIAVGTKNVNLVHVLDRATAGAVMATAFMFMKTNNAAIARKIDIPDTIHQFDYVRPDIFLLRTLARHMILWDAIQPTNEFVAASLPAEYRRRASLDKTKHLATEDMPFFNIIAGICFALGLRYAGSQRSDVRDLLVSYLDHFIRLSHLPCAHYDARVTLNSVRNCLDVVALASATVVAGSGDITVLRRLRSLHGRVDKETPFGSHMAAHMAVGVLFLGAGTMTFGTSNLAVASLCIAFYPLFPGDVLDNKAHLQALRHLWVLAVEGRCLVCREKESGTLVGGIDAIVHLKSGATTDIRSPALLPEFDTIMRIEICAEGWWPVALDLTDPAILARAKREGAVNVRLQRQAHFDRPTTGDLLVEEMRLLDEQSMRGVGGVPSVNRNLAARTHIDDGARHGEGNAWEWLFDLDGLKGLDGRERELVVGPGAVDAGLGRGFLSETAVDWRLQIERGLLPDDHAGGVDGRGFEGKEVSRAKLWEIRALLAAFERFEREDEEMERTELEGGGERETRWGDGLWLRREVVDALRDRVWKMMNE
jgi:anaphase-promoting complex subunit 1